MKNSVFLKLLVAVLAVCAAAVIISAVSSRNGLSSKVEETEYDVSPPTLEETPTA